MKKKAYNCPAIAIEQIELSSCLLDGSVLHFGEGKDQSGARAPGRTVPSRTLYI